MSRTLILLQVYFHVPSDVWEEDLSIIGKHGSTDIIHSIDVGGLTHTHVAGSGRPHHITTKMSLWPRLSRGSCGALIPNISIPSPIFSVSFAISITPISGFLSHQNLSFLHCSAVIQSRVKWMHMDLPFILLLLHFYISVIKVLSFRAEKSKKL